MTRCEISLGSRIVGAGSSTYVIAEIGVNHGGSLHQALRMIDAAADCGADAVKFQTFRADRLLIASQQRYSQQREAGESAYQMFRRLELSFDDHEKLKAHAEARGIQFLSTPFDESSADFLDSIGVPAFKIASGDLTHSPLLRHVASKGKPVLLSTGMSYLGEVTEALGALRSGGAREIALLHCVSCYPAEPASLNLRAIQTLAEQFDLPVGYSDHSQGIVAGLIAVALGACILEKHFTLDKNAVGPDHSLSADPEELSRLVRELRVVESALGDGRKRPARSEGGSRVQARRSIVAAVDIRAQEMIAPWMLAFKRPGGGIEPRQADRVAGLRARCDISKDSPLQWEYLSTVPPAGADPDSLLAIAPNGERDA